MGVDKGMAKKSQRWLLAGCEARAVRCVGRKEAEPILPADHISFVPMTQAGPLGVTAVYDEALPIWGV